MTNPKEPATDASEVVERLLADPNPRDDETFAQYVRRLQDLRRESLALITTQSERIAALEGERDLARACIPAMATEHRREQDEWKAKLQSAEARCEALELALREAGEALRPFLPITASDTPDYAELAFGEHQTQAMTVQPQDWLALNTVADRIQAVVGEGGAG